MWIKFSNNFVPLNVDEKTTVLKVALNAFDYWNKKSFVKNYATGFSNSFYLSPSGLAVTIEMTAKVKPRLPKEVFITILNFPGFIERSSHLQELTERWRRMKNTGFKALFQNKNRLFGRGFINTFRLCWKADGLSTFRSGIKPKVQQYAEHACDELGKRL